MKAFQSVKEFFKGFGEGMKDFGTLVGTLVNSVLLSIAYFLGVGLTFVIAKATGKKFYDYKKNDKESYWSDLDLKKKQFDEYYKQF